MDVDGGIGFDPSGVIESARLAEQVGYDGIWSAETNHDPFLPLVLAAEHTERIKLGTGIAVAFARNPMNLAMMANDLQTLSEGPVHARPRAPRSSPTSRSGSPCRGRTRPRGCAS